MGKIAIVTDSNSGIVQAEAKELGIYVIPMPFMIDGKDYLEEINLTQEEFYQKLTEGAEISTSMPSPGSVTDLWDELLKEYDEIVYIPMSSGLSSSCQTAIMLADDYDGKVVVVNNQRISVTMRQSVLDAMELAEAGKSAAEIQTILEEQKMESSIYIMLNTLTYLKRGGRITPAAAALGTLLKIKPEKIMNEKAMELLEVFDLQDEADILASNLPYGKQRKLEIARALATDPKLLLLDEPAAGMNPNETKELMETIRFVRDKFDMTVLLIEHDMKLVSGICEELTVLNFGQVLAQ